MQEKSKITFLVMWLTMLGQAAITLYLPALPAIADDLHITPLAVKTTLTIFLLGYGFSQFIYGPLSDRYGRKPVLLTGIAIFGVGCLLNMFVHSLLLFGWARLLQGLGCGSVITIGRSILRDCFSGRELASAASYLSMGFAIGLGVSPVLGAYLQNYISWRADFGCLLAVALGLWWVLWRHLPETTTPVKPRTQLPPFLWQVIKDYKHVLSQQTFWRFLLGGSFAYGVVVAYNVMSPFLIQDVLGYSADTFGWLTLLIAIPYYVAASCNRKLVLTFGSEPIILLGILLIGLGGIAIAATMLLARVHLATIMIPIMVAMFGQALVFPNAISGILQSFPQAFGGRASAMLSSLQLLLVGLLSALMAIPPDTTQLPLAIAFIGLSLLSAGFLWPQVKRVNA